MILENTLNGDPDGTGSFELEKTGLSQGQNEANASLCPLERCVRDAKRNCRDKALRTAALIYAHFKKEFGLPAKR